MTVNTMSTTVCLSAVVVEWAICRVAAAGLPGVGRALRWVVVCEGDRSLTDRGAGRGVGHLAVGRGAERGLRRGVVVLSQAVTDANVG